MPPRAEALRFGRLDVAYLGPVSYVLGKERAALEPVAKPMHSHGATFYRRDHCSGERSGDFAGGSS